MSMIVRSDGNNEIKQLDPGVYTGIASQIIDLGVQENSMFGKKHIKERFRGMERKTIYSYRIRRI